MHVVPSGLKQILAVQSFDVIFSVPQPGRRYEKYSDRNPTEPVPQQEIKRGLVGCRNAGQQLGKRCRVTARLRQNASTIVADRYTLYTQEIDASQITSPVVLVRPRLCSVPQPDPPALPSDEKHSPARHNTKTAPLWKR